MDKDGRMAGQHIGDELYQVIKSEPSDNCDEQTNTTTETITMLPEVKEVEVVWDQADRSTQMFSQQLNEEVYQALKSEVKCEVSDLYNLHEQTNTTTEDITKYHKDEPDAQTFICDHCNRQFTVKSSLEQHIISDHNSAASNIVIVECISLSCTKCDYKVNSIKQSEQHALLHDEKRRFVCSTCGYRFVNKHTLLNHIKLHANDQNLARHSTIKTSSGVKSFNCDHCDSIFVRKAYLKTHMVTNHTEKRFQCSFCDYKSVSKHHLTAHLRRHTGEKPFKCDRCDHRSAFKDNLTKHSRIHTGDKPFKCDHCDYRSAQKGDITRHTRTHTGDKPFKCLQCDYRSVTKHTLLIHTKKHTGEYNVSAGDKPFKCDHCDYRSTQKGDVTRHTRIHTGEKPFKCEHCDYRSASKGNITKHSRTHTGGKPFNCDHCDSTFAHKASLKIHNVKKHTEKTKTLKTF